MSTTQGSNGGDRRARKIQQVQAMLAKAASTEHEAEANSFEAKALEIMAAFEIEERELRTATGYDSFEIDFAFMGNAGVGAASLAVGLAHLFGGAGVRTVADRRHLAKLHTTPAQHDNVSLLLDHLLPQLRSDLSRDRPRSRKSYSIGWTARVLDRLHEAQAVAYSSSTALVPTSDAATDELHEQLRASGFRISRAGVRVDGLDFEHGDLAGSSADLDQGKIASYEPA